MTGGSSVGEMALAEEQAVEVAQECWVASFLGPQGWLGDALCPVLANSNKLFTAEVLTNGRARCILVINITLIVYTERGK